MTVTKYGFEVYLRYVTLLAELGIWVRNDVSSYCCPYRCTSSVAASRLPDTSRGSGEIPMRPQNCKLVRSVEKAGQPQNTLLF